MPACEQGMTVLIILCSFTVGIRCPMWMLSRATGGATFGQLGSYISKETLDNPFSHRRDWGATMPGLVYNLFIADGTLIERGNIGVPVNDTVGCLNRDHFSLKETA